MDRLERAKQKLVEGGIAYITTNGYSVKHLMADFAESEVRAERARIAGILCDLHLAENETNNFHQVIGDFIDELEEK